MERVFKLDIVAQTHLKKEVDNVYQTTQEMDRVKRRAEGIKARKEKVMWRLDRVLSQTGQGNTVMWRAENVYRYDKVIWRGECV